MSASQAIQRIDAPGIAAPPGATWSNCLRVGDEIVFSGVTAHPAVTPEGRVLSTREQAARIFDKIEQQLRAAGASRSNIYKLTVYLTRIEDKDAINQARAEFFAGLQYPCSTLAGIQALAFPALSLEIDVCARLGYHLPASSAPSSATQQQP